MSDEIPMEIIKVVHHRKHFQRKFRKIEEKAKNFPGYLKSWATSFTGGLTIACLIIFAIMPFISNDLSYRYVFIPTFTYFFIFAIFAASWDLLTGISGQISFGHSIFFGISGYITAYFIKYQHFSIWVALIIGVMGAVIAGFLIGVPCLRLKGPYLALGTLAISLILLKLFLLGSLEPLFFGSEGISGLKVGTFRQPIPQYFLVFIIMIISFIIIIQISKSNLGTVFKSIRDDETGAEASGINTTKYKVIAFMISALFAGLAGGLYALYITAVNPVGNYGTTISFFAILMASLGGLTTIKGSALGAFFFVFLEYVLIEIGVINFGNFSFDVGMWKFAIFALILMVVVRFAERGILQPILEHLKDLWDVLLGR
ncbi:MAG: branched-chain amino acid ABC transporter permease [Candidatus Thorarchaeota archaeon]